jgi:hypothetical protein
VGSERKLAEGVDHDALLGKDFAIYLRMPLGPGCLLQLRVSRKLTQEEYTRLKAIVDLLHNSLVANDKTDL